MVGEESPRFVGRSMLRREDHRLLTGHGQFVADLVLPRMLHAVFVQQPACARAASARSMSAARPRCRASCCALTRRRAAAPGAACAGRPAVAAEQVATHVQHTIHQSAAAAARPRQGPPCRRGGRRDRGREPLSGRGRGRAGRARPRAAAGRRRSRGGVARRAGDHPRRVRDQPHRRASPSSKGDVDGRARAAPHRLQAPLLSPIATPRIPMECRGVVAAHDQRTDSVTIWSSTQVVHWVRREAAAAFLQLPEARVRCVALDVGGGFGIKGHVYPEDLLIPFLARRLGRPVRWIEDRREHLMCSCHSRDQLHEVEVGFDDEGRILAFATTSSSIAAPGIRSASASPTTPPSICPVPTRSRTSPRRRGSWRPTRCPTRLIAAPAGRKRPSRWSGRSIWSRTTLGLEPAEVRRRNMIRADEMPYRAGMPYRDGEPIVYDSGDYPGRAARRRSTRSAASPRSARASAKRGSYGRYLGLGIGCYVEGTGVGPFESALVRIDPTARSTSLAAPARRGRAWRRSSPRSSPTPGRSIPTMSSCRWPTPRAIADRLRHDRQPQHREPLGAPSTTRASGCATRCSPSPANMLECAPADLELRDGGSASSACPARK